MAVRLYLLSAVLLFIIAPVSRVAADAAGGHWESGGGQQFPGVLGDIYGATVWDPDQEGPLGPVLVVCGSIVGACDVRASHVLAWDGGVWRSLDANIGGGTAHSVCVHQGELYLGGNLYDANTIAPFTVAKWTGSEWLAIETTDAQVVQVIHSHKGRLFAAGNFGSIGGVSARYIASWDGSEWQPLGTGLDGSPADVRCMTSLGDDLVVGGFFAGTGGVASPHLVKWNGVEWSGFGSLLNNRVAAMTEFNGSLVIGGTFSFGVGDPRNYLAIWNGTTWESIGGGVPQSVNSLGVRDGVLYAGTFYVRSWDGAQWAVLGDAPRATSAQIIEFFESDLVALGQVGSDLGAYGIALWNGSAWRTTCAGLPDTVYALTRFKNELVFFGDFLHISGASVQRAASWNGSVWSPLGQGLGQIGSFSVTDTAMYNENLVVAGTCIPVGGDINATYGLSQWNGTNWTAVGSGQARIVRALQVRDGFLYAGGSSLDRSGNNINCITRFDGASWTIYAPGILGTVQDMVFHDGALHVVGQISVNELPYAHRAAKWTGTGWEVLGTGAWTFSGQPYLYSIESHAGDVFVGGRFTAAPGASAKNIARWNGTSWQPLGTGTSAPVRTLLSQGGALYVGGEFYSANGTDAWLVARWRNNEWSALGSSGLHGSFSGTYLVHTVARDGDDLLVGGRFNLAENQISSNWARWSPSAPPTCPADANADLIVDGRDLSVLLSQFGESIKPGSGADFNDDGFVGGADLSVLLSTFGQSCTN